MSKIVLLSQKLLNLILFFYLKAFPYLQGQNNRYIYARHMLQIS